MKKLIKICSVALIAWLLTVGVAQAMQFVAPPEVYYPGGVWETSFPYQRNIYWDFDVDLTPHYEGYDDPVLYPSDWLTGNIIWYESLGAIGIDNSNGTTPASGYVLFHIDNWDRPWELKHVWLEVETIAVDSPGQYDPDLWIPTAPAGDTVEVTVSAGTPGAPVDVFWATCPWNPPWEELVINMWADPGEQIFISSVHVATECVPAPGAILLGGIGVCLVGWLRRRRTI